MSDDEERVPMITDYSVYVHHLVPATGAKVFWASESLPKGRRWTVDFDGVTKGANPNKALLAGAVAAMEDFEIPCDILLHTTSEEFRALLSAIRDGAQPKMGCQNLVDRTQRALLRHRVTSICVPDTDLQMQKLLNALKGKATTAKPRPRPPLGF